MALSATSARTHVTMRAQAEGGGASPCLSKLRPFATAGAVLLGAGLVVFTPVAAPLPDIGTFRDVALMSGEDTLPDIAAPWIDVFNTASENATTLLNTFYDAPYIGLQQLISNDAGFLQDLLNDPTSSNAVTQQMQANLDAVLTGYGLQNADAATTATVLAHTLGGEHSLLFSEVPGYLPAADASEITPIIDFLGSPASGIIMGALGPEISPLIALGNSISAGDDFNETLANMYGAFLNGADLNLDSLLPTINGLDLFPAGMSMTDLDIAFGGLLSTGGVGTDADGVGGSIFNSVGIDFVGVPALGSLDAPSEAVGPLGAWEGLAQAVASLLGWDGSGSPLADVTLPIVPTDVLDAGAAADAGAAVGSAATDLSGLWQDLVAAF